MKVRLNRYFKLNLSNMLALGEPSSYWLSSLSGRSFPYDHTGPQCVVSGQAEGYRDEFSLARGACGQQRRGEHPVLFQPAKILSQAGALHIVT